MLDTQVWKRILWKEMRESGLVMVLPIGAPLVARMSKGGDMEGFVWMMALAVVALSITLWATMKAQQRGTARGEWLQLPLSPRTDWLASFVVPMVMAGIVGAWLGYWGNSMAIRPGVVVPASVVLSNMLLGALCMMAGFAICYMAAVSFSLSLAVLLSIAWLIPAVYLIASLSDPHADPDHVFRASLIRALVGAGAASIIFPTLSRRRSLRVARIWSAALILVMPIAPLTGAICSGMRGNPEIHRDYDWLEHMVVRSPDYRLKVVCSPQSTGSTKILVVTDGVRGSTVRKAFDADLQMVGVRNDGTVYLAQQHSSDAVVSIIRWDTRTNQASTVMSFPAGRDALGWQARLDMSPDGRYVAAVTPSQIDSGGDLWVLDLRRGIGRIVAVDQNDSGSPVYQGDQMMIPCRGGGLVVDLKSLTAKPIDLPSVPRR